MSGEVGAPQQHKQRSRKGKKAWRKNVDVTEVQTGLENLREEIVAGGVIAEKPSSELFALDTAGSTEIQKKHKTGKPLKADEILTQRSAVPAIDSRKRPVSKVTDGVIEPSSKRSKSNGVSHKEYDRLRRIAYGFNSVQKEVINADGAPNHDPWADATVTADHKFSFLEEKKPKKEPVTLKHAPISLAASGKPFPAVAKPVAGKSYNPAFEEWEAHIAKLGDKEVEAEKKRLQEAEAEQARLEKAMAIAAEPDPASEEEAEMSAWESEWEGIQSEPEAEWLTKKRPQRKTQAERNKTKRRKEEERQKLWEAQTKKRELQAQKIQDLARSIEEKERERQLRKAIRPDESESEEDVEDVALRRRRLGKAPIPQAPLEVVLADELQDSLRLLRPEGSLLKDRYRNMLLNGKVESRRASIRRKAKTTITEKWTYKDWKLKP